MNFVAIDFETATQDLASPCAVAIVTVENGMVVEEYYQLIQPPMNQYDAINIEIHGITPEQTAKAPSFRDVFPEIFKRLAGKTIVAHNERFDRRVLSEAMARIGINYRDMGLPGCWECTVNIYKKKGCTVAKLNVLCEKYAIDLKHHQALSDARACAQLYLRKDSV